MSLKLKIKLFLYRFFTTNFGKVFLKILSSGVSINANGDKKEKNHPFYVIITVDTESGYVEKNERRVWQKENPKAFEGYYNGIRNILNIFSKHRIKGTFFLSTNCFSSNGVEYKKIKQELSNLIKNKNEIGLHLHPDSDFALQKKLSRKFDATSAFFYNYDEKFNIIKAARDLIKINLGKSIEKNLVSFRWGNWALDTDGAKALDKLGFRIDSSATPGIKGHSNDTMRYDWHKAKTIYPWKLSTTNYQSIIHNNSNITEIPIATFDFFGLKLRADPVNSILLNKAFMEFYKKADRSERPFPFVVITHSSEAAYENGKTTKCLHDLDNFIAFAKKQKDVKFVTLREAYYKIS